MNKMVGAASVTVTMIRCSTVLLQCGGFNILTDPWFSMRLWLIPCLRRPGLRVEDLPPVDLVLVSHLHPDHFDWAAIRRMRPPPKHVLLPPGGLKSCGVSCPTLREVQLWRAEDFEKVLVVAVPGPHTGPGPGEVNYLLDIAGFGRVFFGGDAKVDVGVLSEVARLFAPIRLAMLPVGGTRIFGRKTVMGPRDAEIAALILQAQTIIPIHEGGIWLSLPPFSLHPGRATHLKELFERRGELQRVVVLREGESFCML